MKNKCLSVKDSGDFSKEDFDLFDSKFRSYLEDNLNTASSLSVLYDVLKSDISGKTKLELIKSFDQVLSLDLLKEDIKDTNVSMDYINLKIEERKNAKAQKNYALADAIRDELLEKGIKLIDTKDGVTFEVL